jgi:hypothetical protein
MQPLQKTSVHNSLLILATYCIWKTLMQKKNAFCLKYTLVSKHSWHTRVDRTKELENTLCLQAWVLAIEKLQSTSASVCTIWVSLHPSDLISSCSLVQLGFELRASCVQIRHCIPWATSPALLRFFGLLICLQPNCLSLKPSAFLKQYTWKHFENI